MFNDCSTALSSVPVTSTMMFVVSSLSLVNSPLMIGGIDNTCSSLSIMRGYLSNLSIKWAYFSPFAWSFNISSGVISSSISRGTKEFSFFGVAMYLYGPLMTSALWTPIATFLRSLPITQWRFSWKSMMYLILSPVKSTPSILANLM